VKIYLFVVLVFHFKFVKELLAIVIAPREAKRKPVISYLTFEVEFKGDFLSFVGFNPHKRFWGSGSSFIDVGSIDRSHSIFIDFMLEIDEEYNKYST
jgi:hypothetical protein